MPLQKCFYPRRMPESYIARAYSSVEEAFEANEFLYVARYGANNPELRGCALLFLGNRVGGERALDQHSIKTGRSFLHRACAAWLDDEKDEARRWIAEGLARGGADEDLKLFSELVERELFQIVFYNDADNDQVPGRFHGLSGFTMITANNAGQLQSADLIMVYGQPRESPFAPADIPVVGVVADHEWHYAQFDETLAPIDLISCAASSEAMEVAQVFGKDFVVDCLSLLRSSIKLKELQQRFEDVSSKTIDLLFTGGITHDFYRDKRQCILPLAYAIDPRFSVKLYEGRFAAAIYDQILGSARFTVSSSRYSNYLSGRDVEALAEGVINLVPEESGMPFVFSERFACFQTYSSDDTAADIQRHLNRYDHILSELMPQLPQLKAEVCSLFPEETVRWARYLRRLLFVAHMKRIRRRPKALAGIRTKEPRAGEWLRRALAYAAAPFPDNKKCLAVVEEGLKTYPNSLPLNYSKALLLRGGGRYSDAESIFERVAESAHAVLELDEPFPYVWDTLHGSFWVMDARIRARCPELAPLVPEIDVWRSFAFSHLADMAVSEGCWEKAFELSKDAIGLFPHNDTSQRIYLRALYALYSLGNEAKGQEFLRHFDAVKDMDGRIFNDFAAMVYDVLVKARRLDEAEVLADKLELFLERVFIGRPKYFLYPEVLPLFMKYNLPHGALVKI